jgi:hypothetical protein
MTASWKVGDIVSVPWGLNEPVRAEVIDVWGNPPTQVRVRLFLESADDPPVVLLLSPSVLTAA